MHYPTSEKVPLSIPRLVKSTRDAGAEEGRWERDFSSQSEVRSEIE